MIASELAPDLQTFEGIDSGPECFYLEHCALNPNYVGELQLVYWDIGMFLYLKSNRFLSN